MRAPRPHTLLLVVLAGRAISLGLAPEFDDPATVAARVRHLGTRLETALQPIDDVPLSKPNVLPNARELNVLHQELVDVGKELADVASGLKNQSGPCEKRRQDAEEAEGFKEGFKFGWKFGWSQGVLQTQLDKAAGPQAIRDIGLKVPDGTTFETVDGGKLDAAAKRTAEVFTAPHTNSPAVQALDNLGAAAGTSSLSQRLGVSAPQMLGVSPNNPKTKTGMEITTPYQTALLAAAPPGGVEGVDGAGASRGGASLVDRHFSFGALPQLPEGAAGLGLPAEGVGASGSASGATSAGEAAAAAAAAAMPHQMHLLLQQQAPAGPQPPARGLPNVTPPRGSLRRELPSQYAQPPLQQPPQQQPAPPALQMQQLAAVAAASAPAAAAAAGSAVLAGAGGPGGPVPDVHTELEKALHDGLGSLANLG